VIAPVDERPSHTAGADNDDSAIRTSMGADASGTRIGCANHPSEGMRVSLRRIRLGEVTKASQSQTCYDAPTFGGETGMSKALLECPKNFRECLIKAEPDVRGTGNPFPEHAATRIRQPSAAIRAASIDPKEKYFCLHAMNPF
jgi:hypothetical protein